MLVLHSQSVGNVLTHCMKISQTCLLLLMLPNDFFFALISERKCLNNTATYCGGATTEPTVTVWLKPKQLYAACMSVLPRVQNNS